MAKILQPVLGALSRLYRFDSATQAPEHFDLAGPVQPVHDVSAEAERSAVYGAIGESANPNQPQRDGYIIMADTEIFAGAGTQTSVVQITPALMLSYGLDLDRWDLSWVDSAMQGTGNVTRGDILIGAQGQPGSVYGLTPPYVNVWQTTGKVTLVAPGPAVFSNYPTFRRQLPMKIGPNWYIIATMTVSGACTMYLYHVLAISPK